jgi:hypothetical protein
MQQEIETLFLHTSVARTERVGTDVMHLFCITGVSGSKFDRELIVLTGLPISC